MANQKSKKKSNGKGRGAHTKLPRFEAGAGHPQSQRSHVGVVTTSSDGPHTSTSDKNHKKGQGVAAAARLHSTATDKTSCPTQPTPNIRRDFRNRIPKAHVKYFNAYGQAYAPPVSEARLSSIAYNAKTKQEIEVYEILDDSKEATPPLSKKK